jgi:hypothetical protein
MTDHATANRLARGLFGCALASRRLDCSDRKLAGAAILLNIKTDLLALDQPAHSGAFERGGMNENIVAAVIRLNEAETFLVIVKLNGTSIHRIVLSLICMPQRPSHTIVCAELGCVDVWEGLNARPTQSAKAKRPDCPAKCRL